MRSLFALTVLLASLAVGDPIATPIMVPAGGNLQDALNRARPGETVMLERGATFVGNFVLPVHADGGVVTVRTAGDAGFPVEGDRMTPESAAALAKLRSPNGAPALATAPRARGWTVALLEFQGNRDGAGDIIALGDGSAAQNSIDLVPSGLTLDRLYIHGSADRGQKRGIALNAGETRIVGCHISDIKSVGQDSQAIGGWNGPGDYLIENNHLEAAAENIMFGGADPAIRDLTPSKIVISGNFLTKPLAWREKGSGPQWQVKNLLELKNARHVVIERNVLEHSWAQAQAGYAVLFTVRNQDGGCPWCQVEDVVFRGNIVRDVAAAIQILGTDSNYPSRQTNAIVVEHNLFDGIDRETWGGDGYFVLLDGAPRDVTINHNTIVQGASGGIIKIARDLTERLTLTNNIAGHGDYGIIGRDHGVGNDSIKTYLPGAVISHNVLAGGKASAYPAGNFFPSVEELRRQFVDAAARDYRLSPRSDWLHAASDGQALGANLTFGPKRPEKGDPRRPEPILKKRN